MSRYGPWVLRALWLTLPLTAGPAFGQALDGRVTSFQVLATVALWLIWALCLLAMMVPRDFTLTAIRVVTPGAVVAAVWAAAAGASTTAGAVAVVSVVVTTGVAFLPGIGEYFVNGSAYGSELRMPLRPPAALFVGPIELAGMVAVVGVAAGPLLLAAQLWIVGAIALLVGFPLAWIAVRALHGLARRWVVFVPAGMVLHDPLTVDAVLFPRRMITRLGPADRDSTAVDLSQGALGLALELQLTEPTPLPIPKTEVVVPDGSMQEATMGVDRLLFTPVRPAALLRAAAARRIAVA